MSSPPPDDVPVLGGVWIGPEPAPGVGPAAPHPPRRGGAARRVAAGAIILAGVGTAAALLVLPKPSDVVVGVAGGAAGLAVCGGLLLAAGGRSEPAPTSHPAPALRTPPPPIPVLYTPVVPLWPEDPRVRELEGVLMRLCREDRAVFDRLVEYERERHPDLGRAELLQLAIDHYRRDHH